MTGYSSFSCLIFRYKSELKGPWWWCSSGQHPRSLNLAKVYNFSVKIVVEKDENKQKGPWLTLSNKYSKLERKHPIGPLNYCSFTKPSLNEKKKCFFSKKKLNQCLKKCWRLKVKVREKKEFLFIISSFEWNGSFVPSNCALAMQRINDTQLQIMAARANLGNI